MDMTCSEIIKERASYLWVEVFLENASHRNVKESSERASLAVDAYMDKMDSISS